MSTFKLEFVEGCIVCLAMFSNLDKSKPEVELPVELEVFVEEELQVVLLVVLAGLILLNICFSLSVSSADLNIDMAILMAISPDMAGCFDWLDVLVEVEGGVIVLDGWILVAALSKLLTALNFEPTVGISGWFGVGDVGVCIIEGGGVDVSILPMTVDKIGGGLVVTNEDIDNGADKIGGLVTAVAAPIDETGGVESNGCFGLLLIVESGADVLLFWFVEFVEFCKVV